ncbi:MAG: hypothetical protein WDN46_24205 [Methylocella sp.]
MKAMNINGKKKIPRTINTPTTPSPLKAPESGAAREAVNFRPPKSAGGNCASILPSLLQAKEN